MAKDDMIEVEGVVTESLPNTTFHVDIGNGHIILAHISGKLRMNFIRILPGDKVTAHISPYDVPRGRITWRTKNSVRLAGPSLGPRSAGRASGAKGGGIHFRRPQMESGSPHGACAGWGVRSRCPPMT